MLSLLRNSSFYIDYRQNYRYTPVGTGVMLLGAVQCS
jgi:hypothetical protein